MKLMEKQFYRRMFGNVEKNPEAKKDKPSQNPATDTSTSTHEVTDDFIIVVKETLQQFIDDKQLMEIPFSRTNFAPPELACITKMAEKLNLAVYERGEGSNFHIKVQKKQAPPEMEG